MDASQLIALARRILGAAGGGEKVPGISTITKHVQKQVQDVRQKAEAKGAGFIVDGIVHEVEKRVDMDLDGDGDKGRVGK